MNTRRFLLTIMGVVTFLIANAQKYDDEVYYYAKAYDVEIDGIYYKIRGPGTATVTYERHKLLETHDGDLYRQETYSDYKGDIVIPNNILYNGKTYDVTSIGEYAFYGCSNLTSITIPNGVTSIGYSAFSNSSGLTSVNISDIAAWCKIAFSGSPSNPLYYAHHLYLNGEEINDLVIPNSVTSIGNNAFSGCSGLTSVTIPSSVTSIGNYAFSSCSGLTSITIPGSVTSIGYSAFSGCSGLTSVTIPGSVTSIGELAFSGCGNLKSLTISNENISFGKDAFDFNITNSITYNCDVEKTLFRENVSLKEIVLGSNVTKVTDYAFFGCSSLQSVEIGSNVKEIGIRSFANIDKLNDVICLSENVPEADRTTFENSYIEDYVTLHVPMGCVEKYKTVAPWKNFKYIKAITDNLFTLTYIIDGEVYKNYQMYEGMDITPEPKPTKEGCSFSGWSEIPEKMPNHDVTVTGTFKKGDYVLTYMVDNEEYKTVNYDSGEVIEPEPAPTKEGYSFSGWEGLPETMPDNDVTVTGTFTINKYKLTYMVDGEEYRSYEIKYGSTITPIDEPTKEGYTFSGWSETPDEMPAHDVTVTGTFTFIPLGKCTAPTVSVVDGKLHFECETEDVEYHYEIASLDDKSGSGNDIGLTNTYKVTVYVSKEKYEDSDTVTKEIKIDGFSSGKSCDANGDGVVNAADIVRIVNTIIKSE